jgi:tRNA A-37 threonylcarbamoyl transferase component Bud32
MSVPAHLQPGTVIAGKYSIEGLLGEGGMGAVYRATNIAIGRRVAIKVLGADVVDREDARKRFELEARAAAVIDHPGIVDVLDMGQVATGEPYIVMEHLEGGTLRAVAREVNGLRPNQVVAVMSPVLDALQAAHAAGIVHRDVKPANIFVCGKPQVVKLLDFGVSRFGGSNGLTSTGVVVGTPRYMAPEQVLGVTDLGPEADLYSVGAVLYALLSGKLPHGSGSDVTVLARILHDAPAPLASLVSGLPEPLTSLVDSLLLKDRALRPHAAAAVRAALEAAVAPGDLSPIYAAARRLGEAAALRTPSPSAPRGPAPGSQSDAPPAPPGNEEVPAAPRWGRRAAVAAAVVGLGLAAAHRWSAEPVTTPPSPVPAVAAPLVVPPAGVEGGSSPKLPPPPTVEAAPAVVEAAAPSPRAPEAGTGKPKQGKGGAAAPGSPAGRGSSNNPVYRPSEL